MSCYAVYLAESEGAQRNHYALYVATDEASGTRIHTVGDIQQGMTYECQPAAETPELSATFVSKTQLGWVKTEELSRFESICRANPPPEKQFDGPRRIDKTKPLRRCQEWTRESIDSLKAEGVLVDDAGAAGSSSAACSRAETVESTEPADGETKD